MDTQFLESFIAVVDRGSFAEAARQLGVTAAAVAQRIRTLEQEFGIALVARSGRRVRSTEAGAAILDRARALLRDVRDLKSLANDPAVAGELRLGAISTALSGFLPDVLSRISKEHPFVDVFIVPGTSAELYRQVVEGELDAAITVKPAFALPKTCDFVVLRREPLVVLLSSKLAITNPHAALRSQPFIRYDRNHWGGKLADDYLRRVGIRPRVRFELDALEAIAIMVDRGLGASLVPNWPPHWPDSLAVRVLPLPAPAPQREVGLLWRRMSPRIRLVMALRDISKVVSADNEVREERPPARGKTRKPPDKAGARRRRRPTA